METKGPPLRERAAKELHLIAAVYHGHVRTRGEMAELLGLHKTTASRLVTQLMHRGLLRPVTHPRSSPQAGRPSEEFALDEKVGVCIGIEVGRDFLAIATTDGVGDLVSSRIAPQAPENDRGDHLVAHLVAAAHEAADGMDGPHRILALGVALHGLVSADGDWFSWDGPHLAPVGIQAALQEQVPYPVVTEDVSRAFAEAEHQLGAAKGYRDAIYLFLGSNSVGGGIFVNDRLLKSASGVCGEIGHIMVEEGGRLCQCGNRGCLETVASHQAVCEAVVELIEGGVPSSLAGKRQPSLTDVCEAARNGDKPSFIVLKRLARHTARALASTVGICGATRIVLGGQMRAAGPEFLADVRGELQQLVLPILMRDITVEYASLPAHAGAWGVALRAQRHAWLTGSVLQMTEVPMD